MLSLAQATKETRILIKYSGIFLGLIIILFLFVKFGNYLLLQISPPIPPGPEEKFGKLPSLNFSGQEKYNIDFKVNTISGYLPNFPDRINVYKIKSQNSGLFNLQNAKNALKKAGFELQETKISDTVYKWYSAPEDLNSQIEYDIISQNFNIYSDYLDNKSVGTGQELLQEKGITDAPVNFLKILGYDLSDLDLSKTKIKYYRINGQDFSETRDKSLAQIAQVSLVQLPVNNIDVYYSDFTGSNMNFIVGEIKNKLTILESNFIHLAPDTTQFSEYGIKTSQKAFEDLQQGKGLIYNPKEKARVDIKDVYIGYFLGDNESQKYLYPIAVFSGNDFLAYVNLLP